MSAYRTVMKSSTPIPSCSEPLSVRLDVVRAIYRNATGRKLPRRKAVKVLDRYRAEQRAEALRYRTEQRAEALRYRTGLQLCCPHCWVGAEDLVIDPSRPHVVQCLGCDEEFTPTAARDVISETLEPWVRYLEYVEHATVARPVEPARSPVAAFDACFCKAR